MDGSVSTLAPLFAAAFASHKSWEAFLVGLAASIGAGISMAFSEGLSDDGSLTGRGSPWLRGGVTRSEEHTSELQSQSKLVCRLLLEKKKKKNKQIYLVYKNTTHIYMYLTM